MAICSSATRDRWTMLLTCLLILSAPIAASPSPKITNEGYNVTVDVPFTITWTDVVGPGVTIDLLELTGDKSIMFKESITSGVHRDDHHVWNPPPWLSAVETYMFGILDEGTNEFGYSSTFMVVGGAVPDLRVRGTNITERQADNETNTVIPPKTTAQSSVGPVSLPTSSPTSSPISSSRSSEIVSKAAPTESSQAASSNGNENNGGGLSVGAKAGIGVGAAIGALVLIAGLVYFIRSKKTASQDGGAAGGIYESTGHANEPKNFQMFPAELSAGGREDVSRLAEG